MKLFLTNFSIRHPKTVLAVVGVLTIFLAAQFPKVHFDNDPENMLSPHEPVRAFHHRVKERYALYDFVIVGVVNESREDGIFNVDTLQRIHVLTQQLLELKRGDDGRIEIPALSGAGEGGEQTVDLTPASPFRRLLNVAFRHNPNRLFDKKGESCIIGRELISPSVVDNIKQAEFGSLKLEYLMENPPTTPEEARVIRDDAMNNPLYKGTLVSEDGKAICLYIPIVDKTYSYNVASLVRELTKGWPEEDAIYITGLPVAEDTFGVEMLVQMATSAPMAGAAIFLLLLLFFRRFSLIVAPMALAVVSIVWTMGLLIGRGFDVHIMSSMIAIFLMPISVADSVHILSEFFDVYHRFGDKEKTIRHVVGHLFMPMLYTSLTTVAGFASLGTTPIPPVRVFGLHVAFGVAAAWVLTMTLIPAYIMLFVPEQSLARLGTSDGESGDQKRRPSMLARALVWLGVFSGRRWRAILGITVAVIAISAYGIAKIKVNDNPVNWFMPNHSIRVADRVLNDHFGGTYTAYLTLEASRVGGENCEAKAAIIRVEAEKRFAEKLPEATADFLAKLNELHQLFCNVDTSDPKECLARLAKAAEKIDERASASWNALGDTINYLDPEGLDFAGLRTAIMTAKGASNADRATLLKRLDGQEALKGMALMDKALAVCDEYTALSFRNFVYDMEAELTAPLFKQPEMLHYIEKLQKYLLGLPAVGKTSTAVDALKKASYELRYVAPPADATKAELSEWEQRNRSHFAVPSSARAVGQVFTQLEGMKKKDSLFHLVTRDYQQVNIWVQLTTGDNKDMESVVKGVKAFISENPPPVPIHADWAGLTYINVVWQNKMVVGMLGALGSSAVVVFIMMLVLFRSFLFGVLSMIPLSVTIAFTYGLIGLVGKDYDMPVAVLSSLTLGLSVDFAIHFLERARELTRQLGSWEKARIEMFKEPAVAISRNAITISIGFTPLLLAPLVPYRTVGFFLASIMAISWAGTLFILPALLTMLEKIAFPKKDTAETEANE